MTLKMIPSKPSDMYVESTAFAATDRYWCSSTICGTMPDAYSSTAYTLTALVKANSHGRGGATHASSGVFPPTFRNSRPKRRSAAAA